MVVEPPPLLPDYVWVEGHKITYYCRSTCDLVKLIRGMPYSSNVLKQWKSSLSWCTMMFLQCYILYIWLGTSGTVSYKFGSCPSHTMTKVNKGTSLHTGVHVLLPHTWSWSELRAKQKVQVKVQTWDTISICACAVECSAAIIHYVRTNDS